MFVLYIFQNLYGKTYSSNKEEAVRFRTFRKNLRKIESHNAGYETGETTYKMGVNQFTDLDPDDFSNRPLLPKFIPEGRINTFFAMYENNAETSVDWRDKGAVLDVQKQGECYSEWAFSAVSKTLLITLSKLLIYSVTLFKGLGVSRYTKKIFASEKERKY